MGPKSFVRREPTSLHPRCRSSDTPTAFDRSTACAVNARNRPDRICSRRKGVGEPSAPKSRLLPFSALVNMKR